MLQDIGSGARKVRDVYDILGDIRKIKKDGELKGVSQLPVSALSNSDRDTWTRNRVELINLGQNGNALSAIDKAMFCLALDDYTGNKIYSHKKPLTAQKQVANPCCDRYFFCFCAASELEKPPFSPSGQQTFLRRAR